MAARHFALSRLRLASRNARDVIVRPRSILAAPGERERRQREIAERVAHFDTLRDAARFAGISYHTALDWSRNDQAFQAMLAAARERRTEMLEREAHRRALGGSDRLLMFMLSAARPEIYGQRPIPGAPEDGGQLSDTQRAARLAALLAAAMRDAGAIDGVAERVP